MLDIRDKVVQGQNNQDFWFFPEIKNENYCCFTSQILIF